VYADLEFAERYFETRAYADAWKNAPDKAELLELASDLIITYCQFYDDYGMPYEYVTEDAPEWLKKATCEQALYLANLGKDPTQPDEVTVMGIASTKGTVFDRSMKADILSRQCCAILEKNGGEILSGASSDSISFGRVVK
jgi:hypothetical protein